MIKLNVKGKGKARPRTGHEGPEGGPGTHCTGGWMGPRDDLDGWEIFASTGIRSPNRPVRRESLYHPHYPGP